MNTELNFLRGGLEGAAQRFVKEDTFRSLSALASHTRTRPGFYRRGCSCIPSPKAQFSAHLKAIARDPGHKDPVSERVHGMGWEYTAGVAELIRCRGAEAAKLCGAHSAFF